MVESIGIILFSCEAHFGWGLDGNKVLVTANVGDARVILVHGGQAIQLTFDHKVSYIVSFVSEYPLL